MPVIAIIGAQWGDEGKGKIVDMLAERARYVVRFSGGDNAGHTVVNHLGHFGLHLIPSGIFSPKTTCVIGNGVAVNPEVLLKEMAQLNERGVNTDNLIISDRAHLIMPYHILLDNLEEKLRAARAIGTTGKGIGPAFADKAARLGIRAGEIVDVDGFRERLRLILDYKNMMLDKIHGTAPLSFEQIYKQYTEYGQKLKRYIRDTSDLLAEMRPEELVLLEGAQGALLDPDFGTYPYTTSSSCLASAGSLGTGICGNKITGVLGVFKVYNTRVGGGPMPTELKDDVGDLIRETAHEYGTTTGRPRRCGWFDGVAARFSSRINGFSRIALTRLDIFDNFKSIKICTSYKLDGKTINYFPASVSALERCQPVYEEMPGWMSPTNDVRKYENLPLRARQYVDRLSAIAGCPISLICVGPERDQTIEVKSIL